MWKLWTARIYIKIKSALTILSRSVSHVATEHAEGNVFLWLYVLAQHYDGKIIYQRMWG